MVKDNNSALYIRCRMRREKTEGDENFSQTTNSWFKKDATQLKIMRTSDYAFKTRNIHTMLLKTKRSTLTCTFIKNAFSISSLAPSVCVSAHSSQSSCLFVMSHALFASMSKELEHTHYYLCHFAIGRK